MNKRLIFMISLLATMPIVTALSLPPTSASETVLLARRNRNRAIPPAGENKDWGEIRVPDGVEFEAPDCNDSANCRPIFTHALAFQIVVRDPQVGDRNGAGIESVNIQIQDDTGNTVHQRTAKRGYCPFGDSCNAFVFAKNKNRWRNGSAIANGNYNANITINRKNGASFNWTFNFKVQLPDN